MADEAQKNELIIRNFRLNADSKKDYPVVLHLNRLARLAEREPADVYRLALEKGILVLAAQHGINPLEILKKTDDQLASAG